MRTINGRCAENIIDNRQPFAPFLRTRMRYLSHRCLHRLVDSATDDKRLLVYRNENMFDTRKPHRA